MRPLAAGTPITVAVASSAVAVAGGWSAIAKAARTDGGSDGQVGFARENRQKAVLAFAAAGCLDAFDAAEGHVHQAAVAAVHGRKGVGDAGADDFVGGNLSLQELVWREGLEVAGVKADQVGLALIKTEHLRGDSLERQEQLAVVLGHEQDVRPAEFDTEGGEPGLRHQVCLCSADAVFEAHHPICSGWKGIGDLLGSLLQVVDWHNRQVSQRRGWDGRENGGMGLVLEFRLAGVRISRDNSGMATLPVYDDPQRTHVSVREYLATSYRPDCDYVDGRIVERNVGEYEHGYLQTLLAHLFMNHQEDWAVRPLTDVRVQVSGTHFRVPDVTVLRQGTPRERVLTHPPLLVIEILSPEDRLGRFQDRIDDYLEFGIENIWIIDPERRTAHRATRTGLSPDWEQRTHGAGDADPGCVE